MTEEDDGIDPHLAPTLEEGIRRLIAEKLRERFPGLGLSAKSAAALAGAVMPATETVIELVAVPTGLAIVPRVAPRRLVGAPPPERAPRLRRGRKSQ